jgi:hypothetical protein
LASYDRTKSETCAVRFRVRESGVSFFLTKSESLRLEEKFPQAFSMDDDKYFYIYVYNLLCRSVGVIHFGGTGKEMRT